MPATNSKNGQESILLIDDNEEYLGALAHALEASIKGEVEVRTWLPTEDDPLVKLDSLVDDDTILVATDYDLTSQVRGLFGMTIVGWCQKRLIPVGDFSRKNIADLPKEPNLFELRVPATEEEGAAFISATASGFRELRRSLTANPEILKAKLSLAGVLATLLRKRELESQFALYMTRLGASNSSLLDQLRRFAGPEQPTDDEKRQLLAYVLGHVLPNAILKYPGPILSEKALCAYIATADEEGEALAQIFESERYAGPFSAQGRYYWRDQVDDRIDALAGNIDSAKFEMFSDYNRASVEKAAGRKLANHGCQRCGGTKGGFLCPFMRRPVCLRPDCSVSASSWVPQGAQLCRVERDFYDEWAPLLGL
ncbi:MAG: hypothetical protein AB7V13_03965 [Pseudorhodoplanes sp.]|uniref:hypothetical protein n=1 Tax=Pseudorhodoplanes sp. TaxID=1934341 RepID=UPI003D0B235E